MNGRLRSLLALVSSITILAVGCGGGQVADDELPAELRALVAQADGLQAEILSDGVVTVDEFERSFLASIQCMEDQGLSVEYTFDAEAVAWSMEAIAPTEDALDELDKIQQECMAEYQDTVQAVFSFQNRPSAEQLETEARKLASCLREYGYDVDHTNVWEKSRDIIAENGDAYYECRVASQEPDS